MVFGAEKYLRENGRTLDKIYAVGKYACLFRCEQHVAVSE